MPYILMRLQRLNYLCDESEIGALLRRSCQETLAKLAEVLVLRLCVLEQITSWCVAFPNFLTFHGNFVSVHDFAAIANVATSLLLEEL